MRVPERVAAELRGTVAALAFLTRVPVGCRLAFDGEDLARGALVFPLVGAAIGAFTAATGLVLAATLPAAVAGAVALATAVAITGSLHLDGLADTADSLGARSSDEALEIMRDPRVGAYGVAAVALILLVEASALASLVEHERVAGVVAAFCLSRCVAPAIAAVLPYARASAGLATTLAGRGFARACAALAVAAALVVAINPRHVALLLGAAVVCGAVAARASRRRFGGVTGDTLGAAVAVTEAVCLVVACAS
jgi:adenosylcobinamide-GDP ribazoletransferase